MAKEFLNTLKDVITVLKYVNVSSLKVKIVNVVKRLIFTDTKNVKVKRLTVINNKAKAYGLRQ